MVCARKSLRHRVLEAAGQRAMFHPQFPHPMFWRLMDESRVHLSDSGTVTVKRTAYCAPKALFQVIEPLFLLRESLAWMREIESLIEAIEPSRDGSKLTLNTCAQSLLEFI
jgi:hypothetical protein